MKTAYLQINISLFYTSFFCYISSYYQDTCSFLGYVLLTLTVIAIFGTIPATILGLWLGFQTNKNVN
jgi:ABC-type phosphate/phosphonate transport system permease subunit